VADAEGLAPQFVEVPYVEIDGMGTRTRTDDDRSRARKYLGHTGRKFELCSAFASKVKNIAYVQGGCVCDKVVRSGDSYYLLPSIRLRLPRGACA
jgi:hypothetical protein